jgi:hypothetical protein
MLLGVALPMNEASDKWARILGVIGFSVMSAFFAVGVALLAVGILATNFKSHIDRLITGSLPILIGSGTVGLVIGLVVSLRVAKSDAKRQQEVESRFLGRRGWMAIYFGAPMFIFVAGAQFFIDALTRILGTREGIYVYFGFFLVILTLSLVISNHIPRRVVISIGIVGWLLIVVLAIWFVVDTIRQPM